MISIITPSFNQLSYLRRCCASVADQSEPHEHIVVDGGSKDGTVEWLGRQRGVRWISEPDQGMYDAINKGVRLAQGDIIAYLNCDEQYLPGILGQVRAFMTACPEADMAFGDALLIRPDGSLAAFRKAYPLRWHYVATSHLYVLSCTLFFRAALFSAMGGFKADWKACGDADFVMRVLSAGYKAKHLRRYLAAFTVTGNNLGASAVSRRESDALRSATPVWLRAMAPWLHGLRFVEKALHAGYHQWWPLSYSVYVDDQERTVIKSDRASFRWPQGACEIPPNT